MLIKNNMSSKGFTIIEVLGALVVLSLVLVVVMQQVQSTLSTSTSELYSVMKKNVISAGYEYVSECGSGVMTCDFSFEDNSVFSANVLRQYGYFSDLKSPIDGKDLGSCLVMTATKVDGVVFVDLADNCY